MNNNDAQRSRNDLMHLTQKGDHLGQHLVRKLVFYCNQGEHVSEKV